MVITIEQGSYLNILGGHRVTQVQCKSIAEFHKLMKKEYGKYLGFSSYTNNSEEIFQFSNKKGEVQFAYIIKDIVNNEYMEKYLLMLNECKSNAAIVLILDKIYQDGFEDGVNSKGE